MLCAIVSSQPRPTRLQLHRLCWIASGRKDCSRLKRRRQTRVVLIWKNAGAPEYPLLRTGEALHGNHVECCLSNSLFRVRTRSSSRSQARYRKECVSPCREAMAIQFHCSESSAWEQKRATRVIGTTLMPKPKKNFRSPK